MKNILLNSVELICSRSRLCGIACALCVAVIIVFFLSLPTVDAAPQRIVRQRAQILQRGGPMPDDESDEDKEFTAAALKTDPELESILEQAGRFQDEGNWGTATQLWQAVLERSGDTLYSSDEQTYYSLALQVEKTLSALPPDGLQAYRVTADASAREIIAAAGDENDLIALNRVVREYFISSVGDDAAYRLGCIYLDRHDFTGARRMFEKIVDHYPDPSMPREQLHVRIALCQSYLGELEAAKQSLELAREAGERNAATQIRSVTDSLGKIKQVQLNIRGGRNWHMHLGSQNRFGVMPDVPDSMLDEKLVAKWQYYFEPEVRFAGKADAIGNVLAGFDKSTIADTVSQKEKDIQKSWNEKQWKPAGGLLIDDGVLFFKSGADLVAWNVDDIERQAVSGKGNVNDVHWRSAWRNSFKMDDASRLLASVVQQYRAYANRKGAKFNEDAPGKSNEVQLFGDRIFQQMSIHNGILYSIEGERFDERNKTIIEKVPPSWGVSIRRTRSNYLTAYDVDTGMVLWRLPKMETGPAGEPDFAAEVESPFLESGGFMSAPVGFGRLVIGAVNQGGAISVYALDPADEGRTVWKSFLCDEPESGAQRWAAINLSVEGSDLFVSCGMGVVFVLDPATGMIRFAKRYKRSAGKTDKTYRQLRWANDRVIFNGWENDVIIPYGRQMICFCSDSNRVEAFDRNSGEVLWWSELERLERKVNYILGVYDDKLYAAGPETVVAFDLKGEGRMLWGGGQLFDGKVSTGHGMLTSGGIYIPVDDRIYKFNLQGDDYGAAERVARVQVDLGSSAPVGNLFSDGTRIWVNGGNRIYGLWPEKE